MAPEDRDIVSGGKGRGCGICTPGRYCQVEQVFVSSLLGVFRMAMTQAERRQWVTLRATRGHVHFQWLCIRFVLWKEV